MRAEISILFGLNVYTEKGLYVGRVDDVQIDVEEKKVVGLAISRLNPDLFDETNKGVILPYRWVTAVGDIVLIRQVADQFKSPQEEES